MIKKNELFELENRYCPICDKKIEQGSTLHKCSKKDLKEIEALSVNFKEECVEKERTFDDKLQEFEERYDNDQYYDIDEKY